MEIQINYSLFADSIKKQLKKEGITEFDKVEIQTIQELAFHAMNLKWHDMLTDSELDKVLSRVNKRLFKHLNSYEK